MSEAERHILKQRMHQGRLSKAGRGELQFALPIGYIWSPTGEIQFDPDEQVRTQSSGSSSANLKTWGPSVDWCARLSHHQIQLGVRVREGPGKGELVWRRPNRVTLQMMLKHPLYAGSYVYGRAPWKIRVANSRSAYATSRVVMASDEWLVLLPNHCPAYISPEQSERNQARLQANRARADAMGVARSGPALLSLVWSPVPAVTVGSPSMTIMGVPGCTPMNVWSAGRTTANRGASTWQAHAWIPSSESRVLLALEPATLELSLTATERVEQERAELDRLWQQRRERAAYARRACGSSVPGGRA